MMLIICTSFSCKSASNYSSSVVIPISFCDFSSVVTYSLYLEATIPESDIFVSESILIATFVKEIDE